MQKAVPGVIIGLLLLVVFGGSSTTETQAQLRVPPTEQRSPGLTDGVHVVSVETVDGRQQIVVLDPRTQVLAVYHIDKTTGGIALKSVRTIRFDLLMEEFGSSKPKPGDIRSLIEEQK